MEKNCRQCTAAFEVTEIDLAFYDKISPVFENRKYGVPPPTHCPDCRQVRRLAACNEFNLYPSQCDLCKKNMISQFEPNSGYTVYCRECWHSDKWDSRSYGREFDFDRPFFEQFGELRKAVPVQGLDVQATVLNSDYIHYAGSSKNCYLIMHADFCEDCYYGYGFKQNTACVDGFYNLHCELCYDCIDCHKCYQLTGSQDCMNCHTSSFLRDCIGCKNCFLCVGLREKEFCLENKQLTREEYRMRIASIDLRSYATYQNCKEQRKALEKNHAFKEYQGHNLENCSGNHLNNCKNVRESYDCEDVEDGNHCYQVILAAKNVHDIYQYGTNLQSSYECAICGEDSYHLLFSFGCHMGCWGLWCCFYMESSKDCFGCTYMQRQRYCILNKQYSKKEYEKLVPKIIEHMQRDGGAMNRASGASTGSWGEFFPASISQFGYNKTTAQMYEPRTEDQARAIGARWSSYESPAPKVEKIIPADMLPDSLDQIPDDILNWAIRCEVTGKPFKITPQELRFYRKMGLPIPRRSWFERHLDRFRQRNPRKLWKRNCMKCGKEMQTTYSPERSEIVYCEECYLKEVY